MFKNIMNQKLFKICENSVVLEKIRKSSTLHYNILYKKRFLFNRIYYAVVYDKSLENTTEYTNVKCKIWFSKSWTLQICWRDKTVIYSDLSFTRLNFWKNIKNHKLWRPLSRSARYEISIIGKISVNFSPKLLFLGSFLARL
jgi:hypothetical protein